MKTKLVLSLLIILLSIAYNTQAQCPKGKTNCEGECGRFIDENGNGNCDLAEKTQQELNKDKKESKEKESKEIVIPKTDNVDESSDVVEDGQETQTTEEDGIVQLGNEKVVEAKVEEVVVPEEVKDKEKPYRLIGITIITLACYFFTMLLVKTGKIRKFVHRKIWNILLLLTFVMSCLLGFLLVIQINYGVLKSLYVSNLKLHVEFGIAMTIIAIIHILWHLPYFKKLFRVSKSIAKE
ncbi:MAG: hypothetical protein WC679_13125 [Bacteroidales bacterium]|jgi:hypothetical protein